MTRGSSKLTGWRGFTFRRGKSNLDSRNLIQTSLRFPADEGKEVRKEGRKEAVSHAYRAPEHKRMERPPVADALIPAFSPDNERYIRGKLIYVGSLPPAQLTALPRLALSYSSKCGVLQSRVKAEVMFLSRHFRALLVGR